ncbi:PEP/pyruvate-binding domain-containing protein [Caldanaerobacter subterraneus]|uniref:Phosphoenolpyruvate synthase n=2 Tax=Caldanaerobacter subterraneus TaxID=911092 RepID=A0A4R2K5S8_9THEO|nr:PEP/pyruvate-binding domain-containing protein [Caldanaerobacter subterraneus]KKC30714.1 phosphoenolpyruvate synthase/pyruvate phosphate dikinase [Caldanaerobacter subterraneus subsp. pacificus DSM 12653]MBE3578335.1 phosphoenolpyruvate synthase [Caldanaerobacter subterraneus]NNG67758.1 phosphoenolpyruvate synthase [Caldanaerobacter subterraneus]TCO68601.1 pyruvate phosphate dikinase-like enzyme [Caldanaerobacter subterraneus]
MLEIFSGKKYKIFGNGSIGGKASGLSFAEEVLEKYYKDFKGTVKIPESFFIATDYYEMFLEYNRLEDIDENTPYEEAEIRFKEAEFPPEYKKMLKEILQVMDYPLAVRSSSLLEDNIKYSFAGKYYTTFISNRGTERERLKQLEKAIKEVYLSVYGPDAVTYRKKHASGQRELMGVIVQRLIGSQKGIYFYPDVSGVGFSRNYRRWTDRIKIEDGVVRLVFGLGTKCTGRGYARIFSLTNLRLRPEGNNPQEIAKNSQEAFDVLNLMTGELETYDINDVPQFLSYHPRISDIAQVYSRKDNAILDLNMLSSKSGLEKYIFTFENFPRRHKAFFNTVSALFKCLESEMKVPVDIEFTYDLETGEFYLVQARPLSSYETFRKVHIPKDIDKRCVLLKGDRMLTNGVLKNIKYIVYVDHEVYSNYKDKHEIARIIGRINKSLGDRYILVGPGRWGSSNPYLGVPVIYNEISNAAMIVELGIKNGDFMPELSYGTHFFADLDADNILYMPVFDGYENNIFNEQWFKKGSYIDTGVKIFEGRFDAYLDGEKMVGYVISNEK